MEQTTMKNKQHMMNPQHNDYATIIDKADHKTKRNSLLQRTGEAGKDFEAFVVASIHWFYGASDYNINVINDLLRIAHQSRGYNVQRLSAYLKQVVPHKLVQSKDKKVVPAFDKKESRYLKGHELNTFLSHNPVWSQYGAQKEASDYDVDAVVARLVKTLGKNNVTIADFTNKLLLASKAA